jgi:hypothetical protein
MSITTTEEVYEDGNRATTIYVDGSPVVIVTMGDGEDPDDYWHGYAAMLGWINQAADDETDGDESAEAQRVP